ncbi:hypothetical protein [Mucilaginibacter psychrotolerans]|uniref:Uncharacterized protein n=1 Tax=Mucilaginibacter psychrotolerans TaxID=1524096 RepID=A0A4Y8SFX9_9SPHI|nr:hypothetical protein [Mucilaginibacter psychrotolerans]TFF37545.1 hypothetical protein E2R66_12180 [Mucilaginibacter psychrotolerans]
MIVFGCYGNENEEKLPTLFRFRLGNEWKPFLTKIQLTADSIIGSNVLTINAPIFADEDFTKTGLIVNDMMQTFGMSEQ